MFLELTLLVLYFHRSMQTHEDVSSRRIYITHDTCGTTIKLGETESLYLDYHGNELNFNRTENGRHKRFTCKIDIETQDGAEQTCIETEQTLLKEGCTLRFMWHSGSRVFMLYGLSTYWCDMFMYGSICMPVWRSRLMLDASQSSSLRIRFSTKRKANRRRILSTNIELAQLDQQTMTETRHLVPRNYLPHEEARGIVQQRFSPHVFSNTETKHVGSHSAYYGDITVPPPYLENPPPYYRSS